MMGKWKLVAVETWSMTKDLVTYHVTYRDGTVMQNQYLFPTGVTYMEDYRDYKWGDSIRVGGSGKEWIEGNIKGKRLKGRGKQYETDAPRKVVR